MDFQSIMDFLFPAEQGGMSFPPSTEAMAAASARDRDAKRLAAEQQAAQQAQGIGAKRKLSPEEEALQNLLNTPRGQNYGK